MPHHAKLSGIEPENVVNLEYADTGESHGPPHCIGPSPHLAIEATGGKFGYIGKARAQGKIRRDSFGLVNEPGDRTAAGLSRNQRLHLYARRRPPGESIQG